MSYITGSGTSETFIKYGKQDSPQSQQFPSSSQMESRISNSVLPGDFYFHLGKTKQNKTCR